MPRKYQRKAEHNISPETVECVRCLHSLGVTNAAIARAVRISRTTIRKLIGLYGDNKWPAYTLTKSKSET